MTEHRRRLSRWLFVIVVSLVAALLALPGTALADAELESTDPSAGQVLDSSPPSVTLVFNEPVEIGLGAVSLFDGSGNKVDIGEAQHPDGRGTAVQVDLPTLADGSYVVDWRVVSADSHPVQGAFTFQVGSLSNLQPGTVEDIVSRDHTGRLAGMALDISHGLIIGAIAVVFGGLVAIGYGIVEASRVNRRIVWITAVVGGIVGLLQIPLEVGYATDRGLSVIFDSDAWRTVLDTRIGTAWLVRALLIAACGIGLIASVATCREWWWRALAIGGLLGVGVASSFSGHGATGRWQAVGVITTTVHVASMGVWLGGLVLVLVNVRVIGMDHVRRYSALAFTMMLFIIASGIVQSIRQVGSFDALTNTRYGTLLIWKVIFVVLVVIVAAVSRRIVRRDDVDRPRLGRSIAIEVVMAVAIVATTSMLMEANPSLAATSKPFSAQLISDGYLAAITIEPGAVGVNEMHIYLSNPNSSLVEPDDITVQISDPSRDIAPIPVTVTRSGASHFTAANLVFPYAATWKLDINTRYNTFDEVDFTTNVPIELR